MLSMDHSTKYYAKMAELQEKLKRSEEERLKLEEKFAEMMKSCREDEERRIRTLRGRYEKFLEDDKRRQERNDKILLALQKIEGCAAALSAKSERLKLLRKHYETYLLRMYPLWKRKSIPLTQQTVSRLNPLSLPVDAEKRFPWQENKNGLYVNSIPDPSVQSCQSPRSDPLTPPLLKNASLSYLGQTGSLQQPRGKERIIDRSYPTVDGVLDNYIQRAADLLHVPVEELKGHEKSADDKSAHTEQDTSRDILNVSLSDDGILDHREEFANHAIRNTKENGFTPHIADILAGGDNLISEQERKGHIIHHESVVKGQELEREESDVIVENKCEKHIEEDLTSRKDVKEYAVKRNEEQEPVHHSVPHETLELYQAQHSFRDNDEQVPHHTNIEDTNFEHNQIESKNNLIHNSYDFSLGQIEEPQEYEQEIPDRPNNINEIQESLCVENTNYDSPTVYETDIVYSNDKEYAAQGNYFSEMSQQPHNVQEENAENSPGFVGYAEHLHSDLPEFPENGNRQEQNVDYFGQQNEEGVENSVQYQEEFISEGNNQYYNQQYQEPYQINGKENDIYLEKSPKFDNNEGQLAEQHKSLHLQYEQNVNSNQSLHLNESNTDGYALEDNSNQTPKYTEQIYQGYNAHVDTVPMNLGDALQSILPNEPKDNNTAYNESILTNEQIPGSHEFNKTESLTQAPTGTFEEAIYTPVAEQKENNQDVENNEVEVALVEHNIQEIKSDQVVGNLHEEKTIPESSPIVSNNLVEDSEISSAGLSNKVEDEVREVNKIEINQSVVGGTHDESTALKSNALMNNSLEEDSEDSSAGFWNPKPHSYIPSVDELAPKTVAIVEDASESSADSKMEPVQTNQNIQPLQSLLAVPPDQTGDASNLSDLDEVEEQLAAVVEEVKPRPPEKVEIKKNVTREVKRREVNNETKKDKISIKTPQKSKIEKAAKNSKNSNATKPAPQTKQKKAPSLIKVLESDSESLNLETGATSNIESDEFDFSTE